MEVLQTVDRDRLAELRERDEFFWLDLHRPRRPRLETLGEVLGLHPVALEDTLEFGQRPKLDLYEDHVLLVFYGAPRRDDGGRPVEPIEVHVYVSGGFMVDGRRDACSELDELHDGCAEEHRGSEEYIVYRILDTLTDTFFPVIDAVEERVDALEASRARPPAPRAARRDLPAQAGRARALRRLVAAQRDQFQRARDDDPRPARALAAARAHYLRDVGDHLVQVAGELHRQHEDLWR